MTTQYTTKEGERFDSVAQKAYGDSTLGNVIIRANPSVPITVAIAPNTKLNIPVLERTQTNINNLPPWKR